VVVEKKAISKRSLQAQELLVTFVKNWLKVFPSVFPKGSSPSSKEIADAAKNGDQLSIDAFNQAGFYLGQTFADFLHILNPAILILGGGVSRSGDLIMRPLLASLEQHVVSLNTWLTSELYPLRLAMMPD
jgi:predicted NBD/HSP70 family sugar kinase